MSLLSVRPSVSFSRETVEVKLKCIKSNKSSQTNHVAQILPLDGSKINVSKFRLKSHHIIKKVPILIENGLNDLNIQSLTACVTYACVLYCSSRFIHFT